MMEIWGSAIDFLEWVTDNSRHPLLVLVLAAWLDYWIGDPWGWPHPVQFMGWIICQYQEWIWKWVKIVSPNPQVSAQILRLAGILLTLGLILGSSIISWFLIQCFQGWNLAISGLGIVLESLLLASCLAGHSLRVAAQEVLQSLSQEDLISTRRRLSLYVGRDTDTLSEPEILRAVLETVTENATDGVLAPLFYALVGALIPGVGALPLALAYKAASTLDSMIGYRDPPYTDIGWFSAQLEDRLTWLPCRFVVITIALLSRQPCTVIKICQRDAWQDPSPNSGWSECAYAAALKVQVGGINYYRGQIKQKPLLGDAIEPITPTKIDQALHLTRVSFLLWLGLFISVWVILEQLID